MKPTHHTMVICRVCGHRFTRCTCTCATGSWSSGRKRTEEVRVYDAHQLAERFEALLDYLREEGHTDAVRALSYPDMGARVIDRIAAEEPFSGPSKVRARRRHESPAGRAVA